MKCEDCGEREGVVNYCDGVMDFTHGNVVKICRQCYIEILERTVLNCIKSIVKQENLLIEELNEDGGKKDVRNKI